jgi:hypothetical protein
VARQTGRLATRSSRLSASNTRTYVQGTFAAIDAIAASILCPESLSVYEEHREMLKSNGQEASGIVSTLSFLVWDLFDVRTLTIQ